MTVITILKSKDALISKNIASLTMGFAERVKRTQTKQSAMNDDTCSCEQPIKYAVYAVSLLLKAEKPQVMRQCSNGSTTSSVLLSL
jgi:hypothetical protein